MKKFIKALDKYKEMTDINYDIVMNEINANYCSFSNQKYEEWQKKHEAIIIPEKRESFIIEANIDSIADLLKIVDENPYNSNYEYNINLKALHNIKPELTQIENMIGLSNFKKSILDQLLYFIQDLHIGNKESDFKHTVLMGAPGTGKTEIANLLGLMYSKLGVLKNGIFRKVTRSDLIAGYVGQTAIKTQKVVESCLGGVLFIDEAYSLGDRNDSFSKECIDTLCESLSYYKGDLMVIVAGYEEELNELFFKMNSGLKSRFIWRFKMESYSAKELNDIFMKKVNENCWVIDSNSSLGWFEKNKGGFPHYGRDIELLFTYTKIAHSKRIYGKSVDQRKQLSIEDLDRGYKIFLDNKGEQKWNFNSSMYL